MDIMLADLKRMAEAIRSTPETRSEFLRNLPSASGPTEFYYKFFYEFARKYAPYKVLEIGTYKGSSIAHLSMGDGVQAVTIDIDHEAKRIVDDFSLPNVTAIVTSSADYAIELAKLSKETLVPFDVLFIDAEHSFAAAYGEYERFRPFVRHGGIIFFDDIHLPSKTREMDVMWSFIVDEKIELDELHYTGFGAAKVNVNIALPPREMVDREAGIRFLKS